MWKLAKECELQGEYVSARDLFISPGGSVTSSDGVDLEDEYIEESN